MTDVEIDKEIARLQAIKQSRAVQASLATKPAQQDDEDEQHRQIELEIAKGRLEGETHA